LRHIHASLPEKISGSLSQSGSMVNDPLKHAVFRAAR
jgi:hypothetical protein